MGSNSTVDLNLGESPEVTEPSIYEALLVVHNALEILSQCVSDLKVRVDALELEHP
jgi:hypothetical protein